MSRVSGFAGLLLATVGAAITHAQESAPVSGKVLELSGKVLPIAGVSAPMTGQTSPLEREANALAAGNAAISVRRDGDDLRVAVEGDVLFDFDRADIRRDATPTLKAVADFLARDGGQRIVVEGHTDSKGSASYNAALSERRAKATVDWIARTKLVERRCLAVKALGASKPVAPNTKPDGSDDPEGRAKNRRVEFVLRDAPAP